MATATISTIPIVRSIANIPSQFTKDFSDLKENLAQIGATNKIALLAIKAVSLFFLYKGIQHLILGSGIIGTLFWATVLLVGHDLAIMAENKYTIMVERLANPSSLLMGISSVISIIKGKSVDTILRENAEKKNRAFRKAVFKDCILLPKISTLSPIVLSFLTDVLILIPRYERRQREWVLYL